jgi:hypothetical protein
MQKPYYNTKIGKMVPNQKAGGVKRQMIPRVRQCRIAKAKKKMQCGDAGVNASEQRLQKTPIQKP